MKQFSFLLLFLCFYIVKATPLEDENRDSFRESCECIPYEKCAWAKKVYDLIAKGTDGGLVTIINDSVCNRVKTLDVWCCTNNEGKSDYPLYEDLKILNEEFKHPDATEPATMESGRWKPIGLAGECGLETSIVNIVGGNVAKYGQFPYMALLGYNYFGDGRILYLCGGSLLNKKYVLTAAHCKIEDSRKKEIIPTEVVLGEVTIGRDPDCNGCPGNITREVEKWIPHEDYVEIELKFQSFTASEHDIALIRLKEPVTLYSENSAISGARPICLPWDQEDPGRNIKNGDNALVSGWGRTRRRKTQASDYLLVKKGVNSKKLLYLQVPINNELCPQRASGINETLHVCAGGKKGQDSCSGDSGGPLVFKEGLREPWYQVGVVSFGTTQCGVGVGGVYTKITVHLDWIDSKLEP